MKILRIFAVVAAGLLTLAGCQKPAQDTAAEVAAVREVNVAWGIAYAAGDADGVAAVYAEDAVVLAPGTATATGREAIRAVIANDIAATRAAGLTLTLADASTITIHRDVAWQHGTFTVTDASGAQLDAGKYMSVMQKRDGKWQLIRDTWNSDMPPAPAPAAEPAAEAPADAPAA